MLSTLIRLGAVLLLSIPTIATSQGRMPSSDPQARISPVTFEAVPLFGPDTSKAYVNIHYRIPRSFFVFVRSHDSGPQKNQFIARGQLAVELFNEQSISVAREIRPISLVRNSLPQTTDQQGDIEGATTFALAGGEYQIVFEVDDLESGQAFLDKKRTVKAHKVVPKSLDLSPPFFAMLDSSRSAEVRYAPFNHGSSIMFGDARGGLVSQMYCPQCDSSLVLRWTLHGESEDRSHRVQDLSGTYFRIFSGLLTLSTKEGPVLYTAEPTAETWKVLYVPVPFERLEPGRYNIELNASDGKEKSKHEITIQVVWPGRPMSLLDWDIATDAIRYIAKPEEIDRILSASSEQGAEEFRAFWKKRDPDTTTAYNEMMMEYYRRVDEAIQRFSTTKERDGYKTDRGRIFILFGPPTKIDRALLPDAPAKEVWTYQNIKKQFIFTERNKSGNYILTESNNL